jgi:hypothetical protein
MLVLSPSLSLPHFEASAESPFGYLRVREGKTRYRSRIVSLTSRIHVMLESRY